MTEITAHFRIVTPLFLGGADNKTEAELRPASVKGALRFWWRALQWGKGVTDVGELKKKEDDLFGSSEKGQSRVTLCLSNSKTEHNIVAEKWSPASWQRYTGYGLRDNGERPYIKPGQSFAVCFDMRRCDDEQRKQLKKAIIAFGLLGGLGARSRKGWGSITLTSIDGGDYQCPDSQRKWLDAVKNMIGSTLPSLAPYSAFTKATLWNSGPQQDNASKAQGWLGSKYQTLVKGTAPKSDREQFGLPRGYNDARRASPLFLHIHQCPSGQALPTALWLPSDFLSNESTVPGNGDAAKTFVTQLCKG